MTFVHKCLPHTNLYCVSSHFFTLLKNSGFVLPHFLSLLSLRLCHSSVSLSLTHRHTHTYMHTASVSTNTRSSLEVKSWTVDIRIREDGWWDSWVHKRLVWREHSHIKKWYKNILCSDYNELFLYNIYHNKVWCSNYFSFWMLCYGREKWTAWGGRLCGHCSWLFINLLLEREKTQLVTVYPQCKIWAWIRKLNSTKETLSLVFKFKPTS